MIKTGDTHVFLADGVTKLNIDEVVMMTLMISTYSGKRVEIKSTFHVIESMCDVILGLNDMVRQAGPELIDMIQRAIKFTEQEAQHEATQLRDVPGVLAAVKASGLGRKGEGQMRIADEAVPLHAENEEVKTVTTSTDAERFFRPITTTEVAEACARTISRSGGKKSKGARGASRSVVLHSMVDAGAQADKPMVQSEVGQDLRRPWSTIDELGPEELDAPYPGMFTDFIAFMETPVEVALAEYHAEVDKPPTPQVQLVPGAAAASTPPPKKERFSEGMYNLPGFREYMHEEAWHVFNPTNWEGIKVDPIEFKWRPDIPEVHRGKSRPISRPRMDMVKNELDRLRTYHLVPSTSSIVSPISDADKATAPWVRICGDYRWANQYIMTDQQYIPKVQLELERFSKFRYFIDLDMVNSFHQFKLAFLTSERLSVITPWGTFRPVFMPEGVSPATGILQSKMREIFQGFEDWAIIIFDNFCLGGDSLQDVFDKFKLFVARCRKYNVFLKFSKCFFGFMQVKFFGYKCDGEGWEIDDERKVAIRAIPFPTGLTNKIRITRMQSFLGFSLYFKDFVNGYSILAAPLSDMTVKTFDWDESTWNGIDYRTIFDEFKESMCECFKLIYPDYELPWILQPDASKSGVGAILFQVRTITDAVTGVVTTRREPIACVSHKFSGPATRWAVIKQEMFAIFFAVRKLAYYLRHKAFQVQTDHSNLVQMEKSSVGIICRWRLELQSYPIESIVHVAGKNNQAADFLSRIHECDDDLLPDQPKVLELAFLASMCLMSEEEDCNLPDELQEYTVAQQCSFLASREGAPCIRGDECNECDDSYCAECGDDFAALAGLEVVVNEPRHRANIDTYSEHVAAFDAILEQHHGGPHMHWGAYPTWRRLNETVVGHNIPFQYIKFYVRDCGVCQKYRKVLDKARIAPITRHLKVSGPRSTIGIDGFAMSPRDRHGNGHMYVIVNHFTKHVFLDVSKEMTAESAADAIVQYMAMFGHHDQLISDPGSDFTSKVVDVLNKYLGYKHAFSLVDRHESNGVEPTNRELGRHIRALVFDLNLRDRWSEPRILALITFQINSHRSSESGYSAFDLTFGSMHREFFGQMGAESVAPISKTGGYIEQLDADLNRIRESSNKVQQKLINDRATDISAPKNHWKPGELVLLDNVNPVDKMQGPRLGPYEVVHHTQRGAKNEVALKNLVNGLVKQFYVGRLSLFTGDLELAKRMARFDVDQHLIERLTGYRGDVETRETMEFLVEYTDGTVIWKRFDKDLSDTVQYESYCSSLPQLSPLLVPASEARVRKQSMSKRLTAETHPEGTVFYSDLRARRLCEHEFYVPLVLVDKDVRHRFVKLRVGKAVSVRGVKAGTLVELVDNTFKLVHRVDRYFLDLHGTRRSAQDLPEDSEVVGAEFARLHPYRPIDTVAHRPIAPRDTLAAFSLDRVGWRIVTRNVNGLAQAIRNGFLEELKGMQGGPPDVVIMQEVKSHMSDESMFERRFAAKSLGYVHFKLVACVRHQFGGIAIASKTPFILQHGGACEQGRTLAVRVGGYTVTNIYAPIATMTTEDMVERRRVFDVAADDWIKSLPGPQIVGGDFNSIGSNIDVDVPAHWSARSIRTPFTSVGECRLFKSLESQGFVDAFRLVNNDKLAFTCFPNGSWRGVRARIDHFLCSQDAVSKILDCRILPHTAASDHASVLLTLERGPQLETWPDFSKLLTAPLQVAKSWLGWDDAWPSQQPIPSQPVEEILFMVRLGQQSGKPYQSSKSASGATPPPPPPPSRGAPPPRSDLPQRKLTAEERDELDRQESEACMRDYDNDEQQLAAAIALSLRSAGAPPPPPPPPSGRVLLPTSDLPQRKLTAEERDELDRTESEREELERQEVEREQEKYERDVAVQRRFLSSERVPVGRCPDSSSSAPNPMTLQDTGASGSRAWIAKYDAMRRTANQLERPFEPSEEAQSDSDSDGDSMPDLGELPDLVADVCARVNGVMHLCTWCEKERIGRYLSERPPVTYPSASTKIHWDYSAILDPSGTRPTRLFGPPNGWPGTDAWQDQSDDDVVPQLAIEADILTARATVEDEMRTFFREVPSSLLRDPGSEFTATVIDALNEHLGHNVATPVSVVPQLQQTAADLRDARRVLDRAAARAHDEQAAATHLASRASQAAEQAAARLLVHENTFTPMRQRERQQQRAQAQAQMAEFDAALVEQRNRREQARVAQELNDVQNAARRAQSAATYRQISRQTELDSIARHNQRVDSLSRGQPTTPPLPILLSRAARAALLRPIPPGANASATRRPTPEVISLHRAGLRPPCERDARGRPIPIAIPQWDLELCEQMEADSARVWRNEHGAFVSKDKVAAPGSQQPARMRTPQSAPSRDSRQSVYEGGTPPPYTDRSFDSLVSIRTDASLSSPESARGLDNFDYRRAIDTVPINTADGVMSPTDLDVGPSRYLGFQQGDLFRNVGDALTVRRDVQPGTLIAIFRGRRITRRMARAIPHGANNYLISMTDGTVLDCMANAIARPTPGCWASIANQADGLFNHMTQTYLTYNDNNAYVTWRLVDGEMQATLYAVRLIRAREEVMWSYGPSFLDGFDGDTVYSTSSDEDQQDGSEDSVGSVALSPDSQAAVQPLGSRRRVRDVVSRLRRAGFQPPTDGADDTEDPNPEDGFGLDDSDFYESSASDVSSVRSDATPLFMRDLDEQSQSEDDDRHSFAIEEEMLLEEYGSGDEEAEGFSLTTVQARPDPRRDAPRDDEHDAQL